MSSSDSETAKAENLRGKIKNNSSSENEENAKIKISSIDTFDKLQAKVQEAIDMCEKMKSPEYFRKIGTVS